MLRTIALLCVFAASLCAQKVLVIGDSISVGYTPFVKTQLAGVADVVHNEGNAAHTGTGLEKVDGWIGSTKWTVITFNFGLHDLKIMEGEKRQIPLEQYAENLHEIVQKLKATGARLIYITTTPVPDGAKLNPARDFKDVPLYNAVAKRMMQVEGIPVVDLYAFVLPREAELQLPANVHFTPAGYEALAGQVSPAIRKALQ